MPATNHGTKHQSRSEALQPGMVQPGQGKGRPRNESLPSRSHRLSRPFDQPVPVTGSQHRYFQKKRCDENLARLDSLFDELEDWTDAQIFEFAQERHQGELSGWHGNFHKLQAEAEPQPEPSRAVPASPARQAEHRIPRKPLPARKPIPVRRPKQRKPDNLRHAPSTSSRRGYPTNAARAQMARKATTERRKQHEAALAALEGKRPKVVRVDLAELPPKVAKHIADEWETLEPKDRSAGERVYNHSEKPNAAKGATTREDFEYYNLKDIPNPAPKKSAGDKSHHHRERMDEYPDRASKDKRAEDKNDHRREKPKQHPTQAPRPTKQKTQQKMKTKRSCWSWLFS